MRAAALSWLATARAMLATSSGGSLSSWRGALLVEVGVLDGGGSRWRSRGLPWAPTLGAWHRGLAFPTVARALGGPDAGRLLGSAGPAAELRCGLCGGFLGAWGMNLDAELASRVLAPSWVSGGDV